MIVVQSRAAGGLEDVLLGLGVEARGGLVEDQQVGLGQPGPSQRDELDLRGGEVAALLLHAGVEPADQAEHGVEGADRLRPPPRWRRAPRRVGRRRCSRPPCRGSRSRPGGRCRSGAGTRTGPSRGRRCRRRSTAPASGSYTRRHELGDARLARAGRPHHGDRGAGGDREVDVVEHPARRCRGTRTTRPRGTTSPVASSHGAHRRPLLGAHRRGERLGERAEAGPCGEVALEDRRQERDRGQRGGEEQRAAPPCRRPTARRRAPRRAAVLASAAPASAPTNVMSSM